jgi:hypothetical protein
MKDIPWQQIPIGNRHGFHRRMRSTRSPLLLATNPRSSTSMKCRSSTYSPFSKRHRTAAARQSAARSAMRCSSDYSARVLSATNALPPLTTCAGAHVGEFHKTVCSKRVTRQLSGSLFIQLDCPIKRLELFQKLQNTLPFLFRLRLLIFSKPHRIHFHHARNRIDTKVLRKGVRFNHLHVP